ncbi:carbonic anhydrase [Chlorogloeopsis fritschii PCC 9212]|uniref:Carbonic anhydrase n=1 Tax=Chlorogloeopsis fritschii PCC 6912 TaxID=211165 RepID=A0A3S0ZWL4_CHLFR|nr:carbonic anhydrase [Chlorogloeopsis fritschii]RUR81741.1 hypothetical protein PCC6912_26100 [Chlorogloeopsis fritschii PCC 6912]
MYLQKQDEIDTLPTPEERLNRLAELNVLAQVKNIYQTSIMRKAMHEQKAPAVHGWVLDIHTGLIKDLNVLTEQWHFYPSCLLTEIPMMTVAKVKSTDEVAGCCCHEALEIR